MTKHLLILTFLTFISCSSDDSNEESNNDLEVNLNPPDWIIGTWYDETITDSDFGWKFTENNAIWIIQGKEDRDIKNLLQRELNNWDYLTTQDDVLRENQTENYYFVTEILHAPRREFTYRFSRLSENQIQWVNAPANEEVIMTKQN